MNTTTNKYKKYTYHQKSESKLLMNFNYYNYTYI